MRNTDFEVILVDELKLSSEAVFDECAICLEHYNIHCFDTITPCNHRFCVNCIRILIQKDRSHITCPLCRQDIEAFINVSKNFKGILFNKVNELNQQVAVLSVNQINQLTHQVDDVTTDQLMTTPYLVNG